jgi:hypothetical protein
MMGLSLIPDWAKMAAGAALGALVASGPVFLYGRSSGCADAQLAAAKTALDRITEMDKNDAKFKTLSARDRCIVFMRDSGLPIDGCD